MAELFSLMLDSNPCKTVCMAANPSSFHLSVRRAPFCQWRRTAPPLGDGGAFSRAGSAEVSRPKNRIGATVTGKSPAFPQVFILTV
ncbi:MAG TPA: hypothetical protein VNF29_07970 [Candidatus Binataceae bacterium]|nr:hypothetical protein [Candidatus Binataceae bacterium]